jgi:ankyrin repeat protein
MITIQKKLIFIMQVILATCIGLGIYMVIHIIVKRQSEYRLMSDIYLGKYTEANRLIGSGVDVNCSNLAGTTPLILAVLRRDRRMVPLLLRVGAQVNQQNKQGLNALYYAVYGNDVSLAQQLISQGANVNFHNTNDGTTALLSAVYKRNLPMIKLLIQNGADVNAQTKHGITPLWLATRLNFVDVVSLLHHAGAVDSKVSERNRNSYLSGQ